MKCPDTHAHKDAHTNTHAHTHAHTHTQTHAGQCLRLGKHLTELERAPDRDDFLLVQYLGRSASGRGGFRGSEYQRPGVRGANTKGADYWEEHWEGHWEDQATGLQGQAHTGGITLTFLPGGGP